MSLPSTLDIMLFLIAILIWMLWHFFKQLDESLRSIRSGLEREVACHYPAFTPEQIEFASEECRNSAERHSERIELAHSRESDLEVMSREGAEDIWVGAKTVHDAQLRDFMIEANIRVLNGTATLQAVRQEWSALYFDSDWMNQAFKEQQEWQAKIAGFEQPTPPDP